ncbi:MAG TPA: SMI1/KNR4 family protein [Polyangiaceae bacterium]
MTDDALLEALRERAVAESSTPDRWGVLRPLRPPVTETELARAEQELGVRLPPLLRRIYAEVADGGFGPEKSHRLYSIRSGYTGDEDTLVSLYRVFTGPTPPDVVVWPRSLVPFCDWGCAIWSCIDVRTEAASIVTADNERFFDTPHDLRSWVQAWVDRVDFWKEMFDDGPGRPGINPFTKKPIVIAGPRIPTGKPWRE